MCDPDKGSTTIRAPDKEIVGVGRGSLSKVRSAHDRQRKVKARKKRAAAPATPAKGAARKRPAPRAS